MHNLLTFLEVIETGDLENFLRYCNFHTPDGDHYCCYKCVYYGGCKRDGHKIYVSCRIVNKFFGYKKYRVLLNDNEYEFFPTCDLFEYERLGENIEDLEDKIYIAREGETGA
jgi:hypothetical protein